MSQLRRLSLPIWLALGSLALSGCAGTPDLARVPSAPATAKPRLGPTVALVPLTANLETSDCLKGRLPVADGLSLGDVMSFGAERHRDALCEHDWGASLLNVIRGFNAAQIAAAESERQEALAERRRRRWGGLLFWRD